MLGEGGEAVVKSVERLESLGLHETFGRVHDLFPESLAVGFLQHNELLLYLIPVPGRAPAQGISPAGAGTVGVDRAALGIDKDAAGPAVVYHGQIEAREDVRRRLFCDYEALVEFGRIETRGQAQSEHVVGSQDQFQLPAAFGETAELVVTEKGKHFTRVQP